MKHTTVKTITHAVQIATAIIGYLISDKMKKKADATAERDLIIAKEERRDAAHRAANAEQEASNFAAKKADRMKAFHEQLAKVAAAKAKK